MTMELNKLGINYGINVLSCFDSQLLCIEYWYCTYSYYYASLPDSSVHNGINNLYNLYSFVINKKVWQLVIKQGGCFMTSFTQLRNLCIPITFRVKKFSRSYFSQCQIVVILNPCVTLKLKRCKLFQRHLLLFL